jgi:hypothetical protein
MSTKAKTDLKVVNDPALEQAQAAFEEAAQQTAPMVQRLASHRDRIALAVKELESERFDLISRRDNFRRQAEAVEQGLSMHIEDIEATMALYESGLNSVAQVGD